MSQKLNDLPAVICARPRQWGNPYVVMFDPHTDYSPQTREEAVAWFRDLINRTNLHGLKAVPEHFNPLTIKRELRGKNLACWCKPGDPCHCDVLLEIANS